LNGITGELKMDTIAKWKVLLTMAAVGWILQGPALAQTGDNANRMAEIVVTAKPLSGSEAAGTVHRITAKQIREQGANTLDEALEMVPGVIVREGPEGTPRIDIRGFRTRHVQLFINGIPIRETFDDQFDPTTIPVENIAEIKVTTGGGSVLYGQGGNGGAIDIITKKGVQGVQGAISAEAGTGERYIGRGSVGAANDKVDAFVSASYYDRDHFNTPRLHDTFEGASHERLNSDRTRYSFFGNLGYHISDKTQLGVTVSHDRGENGKPPVLDPVDPADPFAKKTKYERIDDLNNTLLQVALAGDPEGPFQYRAWVYYNQLFQEDNGYDTPTSNDPDTWTQIAKGAFHDKTDTRIKGISTQLKYQVGKAGTATLGLNGEKDSWELDGFSINNSGNQVVKDDKREVSFCSAALEYEHNFSDRLGGVVGYSRQFMNKDQVGDEDDFTYLIGAFWKVTDSTLLRANHARKVRFPSIKQLYDGSSANPDLNPEVTMHCESKFPGTVFQGDRNRLDHPCHRSCHAADCLCVPVYRRQIRQCDPGRASIPARPHPDRRGQLCLRFRPDDLCRLETRGRSVLLRQHRNPEERAGWLHGGQPKIEPEIGRQWFQPLRRRRKPARRGI
jgi:outer membrane receptor protein involved in Fe transport